MLSSETMRKASEDGKLKKIPIQLPKALHYRNDPLPKSFVRTLITVLVTMIILIIYACWRLHVLGVTIRRENKFYFITDDDDADDDGDGIFVNFIT